MMALSEKAFLIRVYGDSLGMPRAPAGIAYHETYAELIGDWVRKRLPQKRVYLYNRSQGGKNINVLFKGFGMDTVYFGRPGGEIMLLQCGIVDCAPRPIPNWLRELISKLPGPLRSPIVQFLHANRPRLLRMGFKWRNARPSRFLKVYKKWLKRATDDFSRVYVFNILPTNPAIEKHSPGFSASIQVYNGLIAEAVKSSQAENLYLLDVHAFVTGEVGGVEKYILADDGHHLTHEGHRLFSEMVIEREQSLLSSGIENAKRMKADAVDI